MKIRTRALNKGEIFCCSKNDVNNIFGDSAIVVKFGQPNRTYDNPQLNKKLKIKGKVIAWMYVSKIRILDGCYISEILPALNFYVLKKEEFSNELKIEFISKILPKLFHEFVNHMNDDPEYLCGTYNIRIELYDGKFIVHEGIE